MIKQAIYDAYTKISPLEKFKIINFIHSHQNNSVDKRDILQAIEYAIKERPSFGGFILTAEKNEEIVAALIVNQTGMEGYGPKNILVYFASLKEYRGNGVGKNLLQKAIKFANGDISLHVAPNDPAVALFQKVGFKTDYIEMRLSPNRRSIA